MKMGLFVIAMILILSSHGVFARGGGRLSFAEMDTNSDGRVSLEEFMKMPEEHFKRIDTNQDGFIQTNEMEAMPDMPRRHRK